MRWRNGSWLGRASLAASLWPLIVLLAFVTAEYFRLRTPEVNKTLLLYLLVATSLTGAIGGLLSVALEKSITGFLAFYLGWVLFLITAILVSAKLAGY